MLAETASMGVSSKYPRRFTGIRENGQISIQRKGYLLQIRVPSNRSENKHGLGCGYQKISALVRNKKSYDGFGSFRRYYCLPAELENGESEPDRLRSLLEGVWMQLNALHRFSRPHTVWGTVIGIISVSLLTVETSADISSIFIVGLMKALLPSIFMNIYVVGLNQLFDVEIDKVNKPDLPLASGKFSMEVGIAIVAASCIVSFAMGLMVQSPALLSALLFSFLVGSAYSIDVPFLRWKRHAFLAATSILSVRAIVVQFAYFVHMQKYVLGRPIAVTRSLIFATAFMCFFSAVIALFKDIPDVDGDRNFGIQSFSVSFGQQRVFWLCVNLLLTAYIAAMVVGVSSPFIFSKIVTVLGHGAVASILWHRGQSVDLKDKASITSFYMFIWKLFYAEYLLIPFVR